MKRIAVFCVTYNSDKELERYEASLRKAAEAAKGVAELDIFVARNTKEDNPGYFGGVKRQMEQVDVEAYDYCIISNVDLTMEEDFFVKLADYDCPKNAGWIAPQIWSQLEGRDRNPGRMERPSLRKLQMLRTFYRIPILDTLYRRTFYRRKRYQSHPAGRIYAGHGSFIILTKRYFEKCGKIDYPVFLFCEELFLAENCRKANLSVEYVPTLRINDSEHVSIGKMPHDIYCRYNYEAVQNIIKTFF